MRLGWGGATMGAAVAFAVAAASAHAADPMRNVDAKPASSDENQLKLRGLQEGIEGSEARRRALAADIASYGSDRARFEASLLDTTRKVSTADGRIADAEAQLDALASRQDAIKRSLQGRRAIVAEVLAALQRMGRKPPPALLVEPDDVLKAIRTSMLLGAVVPGMRAEIDALSTDLADLASTRKAIESERRTIDGELVALRGEKTRLATLIEARQVALGRAEGDLAAERDKAKQLAGEAGSLKELIARSEAESGAASRAAEAAKDSDAKLAMMMPDARMAAMPKDPARLAPAVAFASAKGTLSAPVGGGAILRRFGEDDGLGGTEKGSLFVARPGAVVSAPADGWIAFAGPYRSFGQLLILNAGGGYYIVLAGMDRVNVTSGQFVLAGEPVGAMGDGSNKTAAAVALGAVQPLLYVEFRKDGATIDPGPWWAKPELQKVRG